VATRLDLRRVLADERGATAVEYAMLAGILGMAIITIISAFESDLYNLLQHLVDTVEGTL
jgi:Flp pilus assembly pilin Flp